MPVVAFLPARSALPPEPEPPPDPPPEGLITASDLEAEGIDAVTAARLPTVVLAMVDRYAASAPDAIKREAALRVAGWLADSPAGNIRSDTAGPLTTDYAPSQRGALMHSGAKSLLFPYRSKTAGLAG